MVEASLSMRLARAPLLTWAIGVGGIFKTPPSGGLLLALSLAGAFPLIQDLGGDDFADRGHSFSHIFITC